MVWDTVGWCGILWAGMEILWGGVGYCGVVWGHVGYLNISEGDFFTNELQTCYIL